jgi:sortase A
MSQPRQKRRLLLLEGLLLGVFLVCALYLGVTWRQAHTAEQVAAMIRPATFARGGQLVPVAYTPVGDTAGQVIGRLEIPQLKLSVPILSNYDPESLSKGVGHIPGTAMPGGLGTVGLAGHRDMYLRPLRNIHAKMDIRLVDAGGVYHYAVDSTEIVKPEQVSVLDIGERPSLTLITCYPFYFVGSAPLRFIVHAHLVSVLPEN